jgi:hypothetical protein
MQKVPVIGIRPEPFLALVLTVAGLVLRARLVGQGLWGDELLAYQDVHGHDLSALLNALTEGLENSPPLYFLLAKLSSLLGPDPAWLRLPSVALGTATIPLVYLLGAATGRHWAGVVGAGFMSFSPFAIFYSVEARPYATLMFLCALSALLLLTALERGKRGWWAAWGLSLAAVLYTHYTGVFVVAAEVLWALWARPAARRAVLLSCALGAAAFLPWLPSVKGDRLDVYGEVARILGITYPDALVSWLIGLPLLKLGQVPGYAPLILLGGALAIALLGARRRGRKAGSIRSWARSPVGLAAMLAAVTPVAIFVYSMVADDLFRFPRNLIASLPFAALALGWALVRPGWPAAALPVALAAAAVGAGTFAAERDRYSRPDYAGAAQFVDRVAGRDERVVYRGPTLDAINLADSMRPYLERPHGAAFVDDPARWKRHSPHVVVVGVSPIGEQWQPLPPAPGLVKVADRVFPAIRWLEVAVYGVDRLSGPRAYRIEPDRIVPASGAPIEIRDGGVEGLVDASRVTPEGTVEFGGWAHTDHGPVDKILAFAGRRLVYAGIPSVTRRDASGESRDGEALGFKFTVPRAALRRANRAVDVYALAGGAAVRLEYWCAAEASQVVGCKGHERE